MSFARPDELAQQSLSQSNRDFNSGVKTIAKSAAGIAGVATAGGLASKIAPLLSEFIPMDLAIKGISKISPQIGQMLQTGIDSGLDPQEGLNFLKEKLIGQSEKQETKDDRNPIQKHNDQLNEFIVNNINRGVSPVEAATKAKQMGSGNFKKSIEEIEKAYNTDFISLVEQIFGQGTQKKPPASSGLRRMLSPASNEDLAMNEQIANQLLGQKGDLQPQQQPNAPQPNQGQGADVDQQLMAALQKVLSM